ncbi:nuclease domain-containing protein [Comamonas serinivorans]|nr:nuclease domain-containing protein [Comamonas serinivorans]
MFTQLLKEEAHRNRALLDMARERPCLMRVKGVCRNGMQTTVAAHSNQAKHGKGAMRKANDEWSVWACYPCHVWLDQGMASREAKRKAFDEAHARQVRAWEKVAADPSEKAQSREAARWALGQLARPH